MFSFALGDGLDRGDRVALTMANRTAITLAALCLEVDRLRAELLRRDNRERDLGALNVGGADLQRGAVGDGAHRIEGDLVAFVDRELFNLDRIADLDKRLLAAGFEYCVCFLCSVSSCLFLEGSSLEKGGQKV